MQCCCPWRIKVKVAVSLKNSILEKKKLGKKSLGEKSLGFFSSKIFDETPLKSGLYEISGLAYATQSDEFTG